MGKTTYTYNNRGGDFCLVGCLALLSLLPSPIVAQTRPLIRQRDAVAGYYSPAALAPLGESQITGLAGGRDERNSYYLLLVDRPLELFDGHYVVGGQLLHSTLELWEWTALSLRVALPIQLSANQRIQLGLEGAIHRLTFDGKRAQEEGITDSDLPTGKSEGKSFNLGMGLQYYGSRLSTGLAVTDFLSRQLLMGARYTIQLHPRYTANVSYRVGSKATWSFVPAIWTSYSQAESWHTDLRGTLWYHDRIAFGGNYRWEEAWGVHTQLCWGAFSLGYQLERTYRPPHSYYHELFLSYTLPSGYAKSTEPRYKSIRLL